ncbi:MAG: LysM peptidoglycan-binding domain-containing protein [Ruminococcaceae bacterium]|nr:LysM peptidoglycan-binding domain-containing protein [Oscillospiraceae bacterium]
MLIYRVKAGDTIFGIAEENGVSVFNILANNGITLDEPLVVGQTLVILKPDITHTVKSRESLNQIAKEYGISLNQLYRNNPQLGGRGDVFPGQSLFISYEGEPLGNAEITGYAYEFVDLDLLRFQMPYLTYMMPFTYGFTPSGELIIPDDEPLIAIAREYGTIPLLHLSTLTENGNFSNELAQQILNDEAAQQNLIENVLGIINEKGYGGLDIDFEFLSIEDNLKYPALIQKFRDRLNPLGKIVITALAPKTSAEQKGLLYEGHRYKEIGEASDAVFLMTYEWGYTYGPPLAVAPIEPVRKVIEYALTEIPREKIIMGLPNYGYNWTLPYVSGESRADSISNVEAVETARRYGAEILFDEYAMAPYFNYRDENGNEHEVWFEDAESIEAKLRLINEYGLRGGGYWNLMRPFPENWAVLNNLYNIIQ